MPWPRYGHHPDLCAPGGRKDTICWNGRGNRVPLKKVPRTMTRRRGLPVAARGAHNNPAQWRRISVGFSSQWEDFLMHPVDPLILDESPERAGAIAVIDAPGLVTAALERSGDVRVWCDDLRDAQAVSGMDPGLLVSHPGELRGVDLVWGHLPKSLAALDEHCASVQGAPDVMFLSGARVKHMNRSMNQVLARHFTAVNASLGRSKCRVLRAWGPNQLETEWPKARRHPDLGLVLVAYGATFNGNRVDDGTRLLLDHLDPGDGTALDLGCGNGVIAAVLARRGLETTAIDVSWSAVAATLLVPKVSSTFEPASAEPCSFTPAAASAALMMSSLAMLPMTGAVLLVCSVTDDVAAGPRLPAASMAVAVSAYWPSAAGSSAADSVVFHLPSASTATSLVVPPSLSSTVPLASAVPETATPAVFSAAVMMLSPLTAAISALAGGVLS